MQDSPQLDIRQAIDRNIQVIEKFKKRDEDARSFSQKVADAVTSFSGSMPFLYLHAAWFAIWIAANLKLIPGLPAFDPFPFGHLTMIVSLEAIFLSTIVLISQNRQAELDERSRMMDLQIDFLAEYEITHSLRLLRKIAEKLDIKDDDETGELEELCQTVGLDMLAEEIETQAHQNRNRPADLSAGR